MLPSKLGKRKSKSGAIGSAENDTIETKFPWGGYIEALIRAYPGGEFVEVLEQLDPPIAQVYKQLKTIENNSSSVEDWCRVVLAISQGHVDKLCSPLLDQMRTACLSVSPQQNEASFQKMAETARRGSFGCVTGQR